MANTRDFVAKYGIKVQAIRTVSNPNATKGDWNDKARHWLCVLHRDSGQSAPVQRPNGSWVKQPIAHTMPVYFSQGSGHKREPTAWDVLDCLASDVSGADQDFGGWAGDLGYDKDSREAERTFNTIKQQSVALGEFLGRPLLSELLTDYEGL